QRRVGAVVQGDVDVAADVVAVPQDRVAGVVDPVGVETGEVHADVRRRRGGRLRGVAVGPQVDAGAAVAGLGVEDAVGVAGVDAGGDDGRRVVVVVGQIDEAGVVQGGVGDRVSDRVGVVGGLHLPVEEVVEVLLPPHGDAVAAGEQVVVVALEVGLAVGGDV